jgi:hypothetical protein
MVKRLITTFFLVAVIGNLFIAIPPHTDGEGGCGADCCEAARSDGSQATISGVCCITECQQSAEILSLSLTLAGISPQPINVFQASLLSISDQSSYLQNARFPDSPTRFLHGSSSRYLDTGSLLI